MKHLYKSLTLILAVTMLTACVTERKKDEAKGLKLFMHNVTAKYNGFFNANVLVQDATDKLTEQHQDNYNLLLDIYPYLAVDNPASVTPDLDKAIEKVAVVATYHRPSHWVDDCYLMMGKAQYLKHDYESSEETFAYLAENYNPSIKKKMNKKDRAKVMAEVREEKKKEREIKAKDAKKAREVAVKEKEKEKENRAKQAEKDKRDRETALKETKEEEAKQRKEAIKDKKLSLEERNEQKRKENTERTEQRRKEREERERLARQGIKIDKTPKTNDNKTPTVASKPDDKKDALKTADNSKTSKKDKEDGNLPKMAKAKNKPDNYFLKHRPCYQESVVWYARALIERLNFVDAEVLLDETDKNPKTFKDVKAMSAVARAALYLKQKQYDAAIPALEKAITLSKKKKEKARLTYILAQLYQQKGNSEKAFASFDKVLDFNPSYEMEFNSRLNKAMNDPKSGDQTTATLIKMSKDYKNREYGDQIYFTLAQIALKKGDKPQTIQYLKQALASSGRGKRSKGEAYYMMAQLQYEAENFVSAKSYYDSASTSLAKNDPRKNEADRYASNLLEIARNIEIINMQDSLLKVANLSDKDKRDLAIRIKKDKLKAATAAAAPSVPGGAKLSDFDLADAAKKSKFWGYNADLVKKSKREFEKKWGTDRKNEDNWRRSNKRSNGNFAQANDADVVSSDMTTKEYQDIMKDVPKTPKDVETAQEKIETAMYQLGTLYHDKLKNDKKTVEVLENYLTRFPKNKQELESWYYLYTAHSEIGNKAKAQDYYDKIITKYPTTAYATMLRDKDKPRVKTDDDKETVEKYYAAIYNLFKAGNYKEAQVHIKESDTKYGVSNIMKSKFALLDAMCIGHELGRINYIASLKEVSNKYAGTPEEKRAQEILRILEFGGSVTEPPKTSANNDNEDTDPVKKFVVSEDKLHYVIIILNKNADLEDAKVIVSEYDSKYHRTDALNVSSMFFSTESETPVVVVRKFRDKMTALKYTEGIAKNGQDFLKGVYEVFAISQDNYREVIRQKNIESYRKFYDINYK